MASDVASSFVHKRGEESICHANFDAAGGQEEEEEKMTSVTSGACTRRLPFTAVWRTSQIGPSGIIGFGGSDSHVRFCHFERRLDAHRAQALLDRLRLLTSGWPAGWQIHAPYTARVTVHLSQTIHGAKNAHTYVQLHFAFNTTFDILRASSCTSCPVTQDLWNYWFPKLYFQDPKTQLFEPVPNGGLLVYYQNRGDGDVSNDGPGLKAFPPGFKMITGNPRSRSKKSVEGEGSQSELRERATKWSCLRFPAGLPGYDGGFNFRWITMILLKRPTGYGFPTTDCEGGLNARLHMPACWDGVNLDLADHTTHTAYLSGIDNGKCPSTHPIPLMKLFYEVTWDVHPFASRWTPGTNKWPFVYSTGDPTGFSWHGDFQNGWDTTTLQNAIDHCNNPNDATKDGQSRRCVTEACSFLKVISADVATTCKTAPVLTEPVSRTLARLPGWNCLLCIGIGLVRLDWIRGQTDYYNSRGKYFSN
ncbi:hypothetical protein C8R43DRAFT_956435 [Mycena crocata]|nr:hypothetical protein C8R43DRAFT_956435 [Mycena crocata]